MRLIDADELLKGHQDHEMISTHLIWNAPTIDIEERLNDAYAHGWSDAEAKYHDAVEVVRCKDCVHRTEESWCRLMGEYMQDQGYCSRGGRKDEDEWL